MARRIVRLRPLIDVVNIDTRSDTRGRRCPWVICGALRTLRECRGPPGSTLIDEAALEMFASLPILMQHFDLAMELSMLILHIVELPSVFYIDILSKYLLRH